MKKPLQLKLLTALLLASLTCLTVQPTQGQSFARDIIVEQIGDDTTNITDSGAIIRLIRYYLNASQSVYVDSFGYTGTPTAAPYNLVEGANVQASSGFISLSTDEQFVVVPGYNAPGGAARLTSSDPFVYGRTIGKVFASNRTEANGTFNAINLTYRSVVSNGNAYWLGGATGIAYTPTDVTSGVGTATSINTTNCKALNIFNNTLYYSTNSGTPGIYYVGTQGSLPTTAAVSTLVINTGTGSDPYAFSFVGDKTCYIACAGSITNGAGIQKWVYNNGAWFRAAVFTVNAPSGVKGLTTAVTGSGTVLFATTATTGTKTSGNELFMLLDDGINTTPTPTILLTAGNNLAFRGVALAPGIAQYAITAGSTSNGTIAPAGVIFLNPGSSQNYTITPDNGYIIRHVFVDGIDDSNAIRNGAYTFTNVNNNHQINAVFSPPPLTITSSADSNGSISPKGATIVQYGDSQQYIITPNIGYVIEDVEVDGGSVGTVSKYTFNNVTSNHTISAGFTVQTFPVIATAGPHGIIVPADTSYVSYDSSITYAIIPDSGYQVVALAIDDPSSYDSSQTSTSYTFANVRAPHTIAAQFVRSFYSLLYSAQANGSINGPSLQTVAYHANGSAVTAVPDPGYHFVSWSDGSTANPRTDTYISNDLAVTASFAISLNTLTTSATGHGKVSGKIKFVADPGYHVSDVQIDGSSVGALNSYNFSDLAADHTVNAAFAINTYTVTATSGANGIISTPGKTTVEYGSNLAYTIIPNIGYRIANVVVDGVSQGAVNSYTFTHIARNHSIRATFAINKYTIVSGADGNGTITPNGLVTVSYGKSKQYTIKPQAGYHIADVLVDSVSVGAVNTYTFVNVSSNHTINASFSANNVMYAKVDSIKPLQKAALSVSPNPVNSTCTAMFTVIKTGNYSIKLSDVSGTVLKVYKVHAFAGTNALQLNISNYADGIYFITLSGSSKNETATIVKAR